MKAVILADSLGMRFDYWSVKGFIVVHNVKKSAIVGRCPPKQLEKGGVRLASGTSTIC